MMKFTPILIFIFIFTFTFLITCTLFTFTNAQYGQWNFPDCTKPPLSTSTLCDTSLTYAERARGFIKTMNITEKIMRLGYHAQALPRLGLPYYNYRSEVQHGIGNAAGDGGVAYASSGDFSTSTLFPQCIGMGATFNDDLVHRMGQVAATEGRAFNNANRYGLDAYGPNINPFKDPRWGRGQETPGEDPYHIGRYAARFITGLQEGEDNRYIKIAGDCKHYAAYDLENFDGVDRHHFDANITIRDLVEYYLPPFETCVRDGRVISLMCSYNAVNGVPACADSYLLQTVLRDLWKLDDWQGWVTSDCGAISDIYSAHKYVKTPIEAAAVGLNAGTDSDCGDVYEPNLQGALNAGLTTEEIMDKSLFRQFSFLLRVGIFDDPNQPYRKIGIESVNLPESQALTLQAAEQSVVVLKNDGTLPISSMIKSIAIIGPSANSTNLLLGNYVGTPPYIITPLEAFVESNMYTITYAEGCSMTGNSTDGFEKALSIASSADLVIFIGGIDQTIEKEGLDRTSIDWVGQQLNLVQQLEQVSKGLIVVITSGGQIDMSYIKQSVKTNAIVWLTYGGQNGGRGLRNVLTGKVSPSGRLPVTQYPADYVKQVSMFDMSLRPSASNPGRTYKFYTGEAIYPFGYGLSYTTFNYQWDEAAEKVMKPKYSIRMLSDSIPKLNIQEMLRTATRELDIDAFRFSFTSYAVNVTNTGNVESGLVVLSFSNSSSAVVLDVVQPFKELIGYERVHLLPGESRIVYFDVSLQSISSVDDEGNRWLHPSIVNICIDHDCQICRSFELVGESQMLRKWPKREESTVKTF